MVLIVFIYLKVHHSSTYDCNTIFPLLSLRRCLHLLFFITASNTWPCIFRCANHLRLDESNSIRYLLYGLILFSRLTSRGIATPPVWSHCTAIALETHSWPTFLDPSSAMRTMGVEKTRQPMLTVHWLNNQNNKRCASSPNVPVQLRQQAKRQIERTRERVGWSLVVMATHGFNVEVCHHGL